MTSCSRIASRNLLRDPKLRQAIFKAAQRGKKYTRQLLTVAPRPVVVAAVTLAAERLGRRAAAIVAEKSLSERLHEYRVEKRRRLQVKHSKDVEAFQETIDGVFRTATAGIHRQYVTIEPTSEKVEAEGDSYRGSSYSSRCTWRRTDSVHRFRIPPRWRSTVHARGLAILDGMVTLSAEIESENDGITTYAAVWVRQGRGFSLETSRGWIACCDGASYHSDKSPAAARSGLRRKLSWKSLPEDVRAARVSAATAARAKKRQEQLARLTRRLQRLDLAEIGHVEVSYDDSRRAGNCHDGTLAFGDRLFGDGRRKATISEVAERLMSCGEDPSRFVTTELGRQFMAACLQAIRRHQKSERRQSTAEVAASNKDRSDTWTDAETVAV